MGTYISRSDIENRAGRVNVAQWATLDGDDSAQTVESRITDAIAYAETRINDFLRSGRYAVPLVGNSSDALRTIKSAAIDLAIWELYSARGIVEEDPVADRMRTKFKDADAMLRRISSGQMELDAQKSSYSGPTAPAVVTAEDYGSPY